MRYISVCSGIEAATVAWEGLGWDPVAFAEIEPFPCAVLQHHFPNVPNLGDISKVDWRPFRGTVDLVVGGTPCQSFSIAGKREGLDGASGLVREYFRLLSEVRPTWFVWENVPGCLSSNGGEDFKFILQRWDDLRYHVAWRVLDAQFFGVAQRRRRVFAVGHLGDWRNPAKVLFESASLSGNPAPSRKAREEAAGETGYVSADDGRELTSQSVSQSVPSTSGTLLSSSNDKWDVTRQTYIPTGKELACGHRSDSKRGIRQQTRSGRPACQSGMSPVCDATPGGIAGTVSAKWAKGTGGPAGDETYNLICPPHQSDSAVRATFFKNGKRQS